MFSAQLPWLLFSKAGQIWFVASFFHQRRGRAGLKPGSPWMLPQFPAFAFDAARAGLPESCWYPPWRDVFVLQLSCWGFLFIYFFFFLERGLLWEWPGASALAKWACYKILLHPAALSIGQAICPIQTGCLALLAASLALAWENLLCLALGKQYV